MWSTSNKMNSSPNLHDISNRFISENKTMAVLFLDLWVEIGQWQNWVRCFYRMIWIRVAYSVWKQRSLWRHVEYENVSFETFSLTGHVGRSSRTWVTYSISPQMQTDTQSEHTLVKTVPRSLYQKNNSMSRYLEWNARTCTHICTETHTWNVSNVNRYLTVVGRERTCRVPETFSLLEFLKNNPLK